MKPYQHTQRAGRWLSIPAVICLVLLGVTLRTRIWPTAGGAVFIAGLAWVFSSLTIEVGGGRLGWYFGPGILRKEVRLCEVTNVRAVKTRWIDGWGIHYTRFGWLYNIAGFEAVAVELQHGRRFALGTDDPPGLLSALQSEGCPIAASAPRDPTSRPCGCDVKPPAWEGRHE